MWALVSMTFVAPMPGKNITHYTRLTIKPNPKPLTLTLNPNPKGHEINLRFCMNVARVYSYLTCRSCSLICCMLALV